MLTDDQIEATHALASLSVDVWFDQATAFTCMEAEAVADFLAAFISPGTAAAFRMAHARGDDEGDSHWDLREESACSANT